MVRSGIVATNLPGFDATDLQIEQQEPIGLGGQGGTRPQVSRIQFRPNRRDMREMSKA